MRVTRTLVDVIVSFSSIVLDLFLSDRPLKSAVAMKCFNTSFCSCTAAKYVHSPHNLVLKQCMEGLK